MAAAAAAAKAAAESKEGIDPTWGDKPAVAPDRKKHNIEMPPDWVLKTSKMGAYAGAVEKKLLQDEARRVAGGAKPRPVEEVLAGVAPSAKAEKEKMVAEVRVETEMYVPALSATSLRTRELTILNAFGSSTIVFIACNPTTLVLTLLKISSTYVHPTF